MGCARKDSRRSTRVCCVFVVVVVVAVVVVVVVVGGGGGGGVNIASGVANLVCCERFANDSFVLMIDVNHLRINGFANWGTANSESLIAR